jgi:tRNA uridine 5-carboxymethylaminomethyl modification enzyme
VNKERFHKFQQKKSLFEESMRIVRSFKLSASDWQKKGFTVSQDGSYLSAEQLLGRGFGLEKLSPFLPLLPFKVGKDFSTNPLDCTLQRLVETECCYSLFLDRQHKEIAAFQRDENLALPENTDYQSLGFLSAEEKEKLEQAQPATLGMR